MARFAWPVTGSRVGERVSQRQCRAAHVATTIRRTTGHHGGIPLCTIGGSCPRLRDTRRLPGATAVAETRDNGQTVALAARLDSFKGSPV